MTSYKQRGFTLIELLITIIILGILAVMGMSMFLTTQKKGRDLNRKASLKAVAKALESYMNDKGRYPASSNDGKILWCGDSDSPEEPCSWGDAFVDVGIPEGSDQTVYMAALPKDTVSSQSYFYEGVDIGGDGQIKGYRLYARLENSKDPDVPVVNGNPSQYTTICSTGAVTQYCNYVITSETVPVPTP